MAGIIAGRSMRAADAGSERMHEIGGYAGLRPAPNIAFRYSLATSPAEAA